MSNPALDIPFDEADGSTIAYDYGPGGHHAAIEAGRFIPGKFGNRVYFPGEGKAEIIGPVIDFSQDFTFMIWAKAELRPSWPTRTWAVFKFPGKDNFREIELFTRLEYWSHAGCSSKASLISLVHNGCRSTPVQSSFCLKYITTMPCKLKTNGVTVNFKTSGFKYPLRNGKEVTIVSTNDVRQLYLMGFVKGANSLSTNGGTVTTLIYVSGEWYIKSQFDNNW